MKSYASEDLKIVELNQNKTKKFNDSEEDDEVPPPPPIQIKKDLEPIILPEKLNVKSILNEEYAKSFVTFQPIPRGNKLGASRPALFGTPKENRRSTSVTKFNHRERIIEREKL